MSDMLALFCGGPSLYSGVPKPLQILDSGNTLLEHYLRYIEPTAPREVILLADSLFIKSYISFIEGFAYTRTIRVFPCHDRSTTLMKLNEFLSSVYPEDLKLIFSYPDIFTSCDAMSSSLMEGELSDTVFVSFAPIASRFPRLIVNPYNLDIHGISTHASPVPANPIHVFGGHLLARSGVMRSLVTTFLSNQELSTASLEFDMFSWLINISRIKGVQLYGDWIQADSTRQLNAIVNLPYH